MIGNKPTKTKSRIVFTLILGVIIASSSVLPQTNKVDEASAQTPLRLNSISFDRQWNHEGFNVKRLPANLEVIPGTEATRNAGVILLSEKANSGTNDLEIFTLKEGAEYAEGTGYYIYTQNYYQHCGGSSRYCFYSPYAVWLNDQLVVHYGEKWFLFDPITGKATLWFSQPAYNQDPVYTERCAEIRNGDCYLLDPVRGEILVNHLAYRVTVVNNGLLFTHAYRTDDYVGFNDFVGHFVSSPNNSQVIYEEPENADFRNYYLAWNHLPYSTIQPHNPVLEVTGVFGTNGPVIGQIGYGVYVSQYDRLTRIGYTGCNVHAALDGCTYSSMAFGQNSAIWKGADNNIYVARLYNQIQETPITDEPYMVPFRSNSRPTVYLSVSNGYSPATINFLNETQYFEMTNDTDFSDVVFVDDSVVENKVFQDNIKNCSEEPSFCENAKRKYQSK